MRTDTKEVPVKADGASKVPPIPKNGTLRFPVPNPVFVTEGTWPKGSMWARDPVSSPEYGILVAIEIWISQCSFC